MAPKKTATVFHAFEPVFDENSRVLMLGTMPSPKSREAGFYYSHPQNRFWPLMADVFAAPLPETPEEKRHFVLNRRIALWDVLRSCEIAGADDAAIRNPVVNDMSVIFRAAPIAAVFTTGRKATELYNRRCLGPENTLAAFYLPSTSPANRGFSYAALLEAYRAIREFL